MSPTGRPEGEFAPKRASAEGSPVSVRRRHAVRGPTTTDPGGAP
jgi:hypothetical protein